MRALLTAAVAVATAMLAGCGEPMPGRSRSLGDVPYEKAFATARQVVQQHFSVESADSGSGVIKTRPRFVGRQPSGLLSHRPARKIALVRLRRGEGDVVAFASIQLQTQGQTARSAFQPPEDNYSSVPHETPAQQEAATTAEQNEDWITQSYDHALENAILNEIYLRLHPRATEETTENTETTEGGDSVK